MAAKPTGPLIFFLMAGIAFSATYYVDSSDGNDGNAGTSQAAAWKSIANVNSTTFSPGDRILFKANGYWTGKLNPKGSGASGNPIIIDSYGTGYKPIIDGNGSTGDGVLYFHNQEYWEANNLELTNDAGSGGDRRGVSVTASNFGTIDHIYLKDLDIHNIKGIVAQTTAAKRTGGINIRVLDDATMTRFNDILIENCTIAACDGSGISNEADTSFYPGTPGWNQRKYTDYIIRGNSINDISKNAMIVRMADSSCLVEYNLCWDTAFRTGTGNTIFSRSCLGTVFQYNEGYLNRTTDFDGCLYDADISSPECVFQYSYSHDNNHGLFWMCTTDTDNDIIVRYNISQNDKGSIFCMNFAHASAYVYNNTIYIPEHLSPRIVDERRNAAKTYYFYNNIIYNASPTAVYQWFDGNRTFDYNTFYGYHPASEPNDLHKLTSDPMFVAPGTGGIGLNTVVGYKLQAGSPCIDSGLSLANNGGLDFWGNAVPYNGVTDRGAHEYQPSAPDTTPPSPNPMAFAQVPYATSCSSIAMVAQTASDPSAVEYYFACASGGGHDSGWQSTPSYTDTDLSSNTQYSYTVKARDFSINHNETAASGPPASATTNMDGGASVNLFSDGFDECFLNWSSNAWCSSTAYEGSLHSCKMNDTDYAETGVDTTGHSDILVTYARNTSDLTSGDSFISEWYDGSSWNAIENITSGFSGWELVSQVELPAEADNNPSFKIRFRVVTAGQFAYVDAVSIEGMTPCCAGLADIDCSGTVDVDDFAAMASVWLTDNSAADIAEPEDGQVDLIDFSVLAQEWLK